MSPPVDNMVEMVKKVEAAVKPLGRPGEVLPACLIICAEQAYQGGSSPEEFVVSILPWVVLVWGERFDPGKMANAIADAATRHARESGQPLDAYEQALVASIRRNRKGKRGSSS